MNDSKNLAFSISIEGVSQEGEELAKIVLQLQNLKKERAELIKQASSPGHIASTEERQKLAAYNKEIKTQEEALKTLKRVVDSASDSLARKKALLIELKTKADGASESVRERMAPAIKKLNDEISKAEQANGVFTRNVGNYPNLMGQASAAAQDLGAKITSSMQNLLSAGTIMAVVAVGLKKLKEAFESTVQGMDFMNQVAQVSKQMFYDLATSMTFNVNKMMQANEIAKEMNAIRQGDLIDMVKIRDMENDIKDMRLKSVDATRSLADQQKYLNEAIQKEDELIKYKTKDAKEDLAVIEKSLKLRPEDYNLQLQYAQKIAELRDIQSEKSLRLASKESAIREKAQKEEEATKKAWDAYIAEIDEALKKTDALNAANEELWIKIRMQAEKDFMAMKPITPVSRGDIPAELAAEQAIQAKKNELWEEGMQKAKENYAKNKQLAIEQNKELHSIDLQKIEAKRDIILMEADLVLGGVKGLSQIFGKSKALAIAAMALEKGAAIPQIISNIAIANAKMIAMSPATFGQPWVTINTGLGALAIGGIVAETIKGAKEISKYATGGRTSHGLPIDTGTPDNLLIAVKKDKEAVLNERHIARLGGSRVMRNIGVPGFAEGGAIGSMPYINPSVPASSADIQNMSERLGRIEVWIDINKVRSAIRESEVITESQRI